MRDISEASVFDCRLTPPPPPCVACLKPGLPLHLCPLRCSLRPAQALREAALLCQLRHPQQGGEEPLLRGQERPHPTTQVQTCCEYLSQE